MEHTTLYKAFQQWVQTSYDTADKPYRQGVPQSVRTEQEYLEYLIDKMGKDNG